VRPQRRPVLAITALALVVATLAWGLFVALPRKYRAANAPAAALTAPAAPSGPKIKAELFYVSDDGQQLIAVEREVPFAEGTVEQARQIVAAAVAPVSEPLVSSVPAGTTLRSVFVTDHGDAYVDLSREITANHPGGTLSEILTVYAVVNSLTANLPAIKSVQLLVDGKEVATLAGHVDLRRPLTKNLSWVQ
jgi:spore germination protein GerM